MEEKKLLVVGPSAFAVAFDAQRQLVVGTFDLPEKETGLVKGLLLAVAMSPTEARQIAAALIRKADDADGRSFRA